MQFTPFWWCFRPFWRGCTSFRSKHFLHRAAKLFRGMVWLPCFPNRKKFALLKIKDHKRSPHPTQHHPRKWVPCGQQRVPKVPWQIQCCGSKALPITGPPRKPTKEDCLANKFSYYFRLRIITRDFNRNHLRRCMS